MKTPSTHLKTRSAAILAVLLSVGCSTTYVNHPDKSREVSQSRGLSEVVYFQVNQALEHLTPQCIHVLPFEDPLNLDPNGNFRKAFHAQLSITGVRLVPLQAILQMSYEEVRQHFKCDFELKGTVTNNSRLFLGVYSEYKAGTKVELVHLPSKQVYWQASHSMVKRSGGLPIGLISSISGAANATKNVGPEQAVRVSYELAHKLVESIPRLEFESSQAHNLAHVGGEPEEAFSEATIDAQQEQAHLPLVRAFNHQAKGQHEQATSDFILAIAQGDSTEIPYMGLGQSYAAVGRFDFAAAAYEKAYQLNESNIDALVLAGIAHYATGDNEFAYERLMDALIKSLAIHDKTVAGRVVNAMHATGLFSQLSQQDQLFLESQL